MMRAVAAARSDVETHRKWFLPHDAEWAWLLLCLSGLTFAQRTANESLSGTIGATDTTRLGLLSLALIIVTVQLKHLPRFALNPISVFLIYVTMAICSSVWSESPVNTLGKAAELLGAVVIVWMAMARSDGEVRLRRLAYWVIAEIVAALLYVTIGNLLDLDGFHEAAPRSALFAYSWASPRISSNLISQIGALLSLFCLALLSEKRGGSLFLIVGCVTGAVFPALSQGRTGMVSLAVGTVLILVRKFPVLSVVAAGPIAGLATALFGDKLVTLFLRGQDNALLFSLSGRTTWWELGWTAFLRRPLIGAGWGVGSRVAVREFGGIVMADVSTLHNGLLEVLLGVGLVGFAIWACVVIWSYGLATAAYLKNHLVAFVVGLVVCATATLLSTGVGSGLDFITQYFLAVTALLWVQRQQQVTTARLKNVSAAIRPHHAGTSATMTFPGRFSV
jgi:O-antigen ligase